MTKDEILTFIKAGYSKADIAEKTKQEIAQGIMLTDDFIDVNGYPNP